MKAKRSTSNIEHLTTSVIPNEVRDLALASRTTKHAADDFCFDWEVLRSAQDDISVER
jgi:hypothetical protein